jgi:hypothetical protein
MDPCAGPGYPVLRYLAIVRAARDFGLEPGRLEALASRFAGSVEEFTDAVAVALLSRS